MWSFPLSRVLQCGAGEWDELEEWVERVQLRRCYAVAARRESPWTAGGGGLERVISTLGVGSDGELFSAMCGGRRCLRRWALLGALWRSSWSTHYFRI